MLKRWFLSPTQFNFLFFIVYDVISSSMYICLAYNMQCMSVIEVFFPLSLTLCSVSVDVDSFCKLKGISLICCSV